MSSKLNTKAKVAIGIVASLGVLGGVGATLAYADPSSPTPTPSASASASPSNPSEEPAREKGERRGLLRRALHGEVTLGGPKHRVVVFQRGEVTQVSGTAIAIRSEDGFSATYVLDADLRVRQDQQDAKIADVKVGTRVRVLATKQDSTLTARRIVLVG